MATTTARLHYGGRDFRAEVEDFGDPESSDVVSLYDITAPGEEIFVAEFETVATTPDDLLHEIIREITPSA